MEPIEDVIRRIREERGADMMDVYRVCESHEVLYGALAAICDGHRDPRTLARATLDFVAGHNAETAMRVKC